MIMEKDSSYYNDEVSRLQKKVQVDPRDAETWKRMIALAEEAVSAGVDAARWEKALKVMHQQYELMCL